MIKRLERLIFVCLLALGVSVQHAAAAPGDYEGDGRSDLAVALVRGATKTTEWLVRQSSNSNPLFYVFNLPADAFVSGKFYSDDKTYPGIVYVRNAATPLEWYIKNPQGSENVLYFGLPGDIVPNQADVDCDGVTDIAVVRNGTANRFPGFKLWYFALSGSGVQQENVFGLATDSVALADLTGDGCAELVALRDGFVWFGKSLFGDAISQVQWGLKGDIPLLPKDMNGDGKPDYIISRATGAGQVAFIRLSETKSKTVPLGQDTSVPMVGNFTGRNGFAWLQQDTGFTAIEQANGVESVFPFGISENTVIRPDGTVVLGKEKVASGCDNVVGIDDLDGVLYKPVNVHGGRGPTFIVKNPSERTNKKRIEIRDANCNIISYFGLFATDGQYGSRYYERSGGGNHSDRALLALANQAGSTAIYVEGTRGKWIRVDNPLNRDGSL